MNRTVSVKICQRHKTIHFAVYFSSFISMRKSIQVNETPTEFAEQFDIIPLHMLDLKTFLPEYFQSSFSTVKIGINRLITKNILNDFLKQDNIRFLSKIRPLYILFACLNKPPKKAKATAILSSISKTKFASRTKRHSKLPVEIYSP